MIVASGSVDMWFEITRRTAVRIQLVEFSANPMPLLGKARQEELSQNIDNARLVRTDVRRESRRVKLRRFPILFIENGLATEAEGSWLACAKQGLQRGFGLFRCRRNVRPEPEGPKRIVTGLTIAS